MQLEERIDTLSKEARAQKTSAEASHMLTNEVKEELLQVCIIILVVSCMGEDHEVQ